MKKEETLRNSESMFEIAQRYLCDNCEYSKVREA